MNHKKIPWVNDKFILMIKQKKDAKCTKRETKLQ